MGVYEGEPVGHRGMHWQQNQPERYVGPSAYDPSRDLSPNLPVDNKSSMGDVEHYSSGNGLSGSSNNNNNSCSVSSCSFRHGPTTSQYEHGEPCLQYPRRTGSPLAFGRFEHKPSFRPTSPTLISRFEKLNEKPTSPPSHYFKPPTPSCGYNLKKPPSPSPCVYNAAKVEDFKPPHFELGKLTSNNNNNNNNSNINNNNNNHNNKNNNINSNNSDGQCHNEFQDFKPKMEQLPTPGTPGTPLSSSEDTTDCAGCGRRIVDRFYLSAVDRKWHASCLQCCQCHAALDGEITCFTRHGNIYCKKDYYRMFVMKRCSRCQAAISSSELVMRARDLVFHIQCFTCTVCNTTLTKGDHFGLRDGAIYCRNHYDLNEQTDPENQSVYQHYPSSFPSPEFHQHPSPIPLPPPGPSPPESVLTSKVPFFNGSSATTPRQKGRPRKRKPKDLEGMTANLDLNDSYLDFGRGPSTPGMNASGRSKRMRTSFKHHQLRTMKSYFSINHNPDAKDLKQLSQKTSLPKRVLQVWFQNARAKWRRMMVKQEGKSDKCSESGGLSDMETYPPHSSGSVGGPMSIGPHSPPFVLSNSSPASLECS